MFWSQCNLVLQASWSLRKYWEKNANQVKIPVMDETNIRRNYSRLNFLLNSVGGNVLRHHFYQRYLLLTGLVWQDGSEEAKEFVGKEILERNTFRRIQTEMIQTGDSNNWDITILSVCLLKISYSENPSLELRKVNKNVAILTDLRNQLAHLPDITVPDAKFQSMWDEAERALVVLGVAPDDLENVKTAPRLELLQVPRLDLQKEKIELALSLCHDGNEAVRSNCVMEGIQLHTKALAIQGVPEDIRATLHSNRSHSYLKLIFITSELSPVQVKEYAEKAMEDAKMTVRLQPGWWKGYVRQGRVHQLRQELESAKMAFDKATELYPGFQGQDQNWDWDFAQKMQQVEPEIVPEPEESKPDVFQLLTDAFMKSSDPIAMSMGYMARAQSFLQGDSIPVDRQKAADLYAQAASTGNPEAMYNLAMMKLEDEGNLKDARGALVLLEDASKLTTKTEDQIFKKYVGLSKFQLAKCFEEGIGGDQDYTKAIQFYKLALKMQVYEAANRLGCIYHDGIGVPQHVERALSYWTLAADSGIPSAIMHLARSHLQRENSTKAEFWFKRVLLTGSVPKDALDFETELDALKSRPKPKKIEAKVEEKVTLEDTAKEDPHSGDLQSTEDLENLPPEAEEPLRPENTDAYEDDCEDLGNYWLFEEEIRSRAAIPEYSFAQSLLSSMEAFVNGMESLGLFVCNELEDSVTGPIRNQMLQNFASAFTLSTFDVTLPPAFSVILREITDDVLITRRDVPDLLAKLNARICGCFLRKSNLRELQNFVKVALDKYPVEEYFHNVQAQAFFEHRKYKEGISACKKSLQSFPFGCDLLLTNAKLILFFMDSTDSYTRTNLKKVKSACANFLKLAPLDHPGFAEANYGQAFVSYCLEKYSEGGSYLQRASAEEEVPWYWQDKECTLKDLFERRLSLGFSEISLRLLNGKTESKNPENDHSISLMEQTVLQESDVAELPQPNQFPDQECNTMSTTEQDQRVKTNVNTGLFLSVLALALIHAMPALMQQTATPAYPTFFETTLKVLVIIILVFLLLTILVYWNSDTPAILS